MKKLPRVCWRSLIIAAALFAGLDVARAAPFRGTVATAQAATPTPIPKGPVYVQMSPIATGLTSPVSMATPRDGSGRLFIVQQTGQVRILRGGAVLATPFLDVSARLVALGSGYDERGLLGFAFHPDFANANAPGFGRVYTYTSEPLAGAADFTVPNGGAFNHQSVIAEWQVSSVNPDVIDPATRREVLRIDQPQATHNAGDLHFRAADGYLYLALGDGGGANDVGIGHNAAIGNGQDRSNVLGKLLRIDPLHPSLTSGSPNPMSANGKYRVPATNPFVGQSGLVAEIYNYGFRNPYRFSFDAPTDQLVIADVGQNNIEEIDLGTAGGNFGWNRKEGSFLFNSSTGTIANDPNPDPAYLNPIAQYSHTDGQAVIGGHVYRGALLPGLAGQYVFGDYALFSGRLFHASLVSGSIVEFRLGLTDPPLGLYLKGFGRDHRGELYALADANSGPSGTGGQVLKFTTIPPASAVSRKLHGGTPYDINLLTTPPAIEPRSGGAGGNYQIVIGFPAPITVGGALVTPDAGATGSLVGTPVVSGNQVTVDLTGVSTAQLLTVTLTGVNDGSVTRDVSVQMGVLVGDTSGDATVNSADAQQTRSRSGGAIDANTFRSDVNTDGAINSADVTLIRARSGASIPQ
ncbi:MAG: PQQ-dependent sugar dehydrogenase [Vicinamibacterales bacterium]